jgi:dinuclear metal center YbgI/SA1388 family protein
VRRSALGVGELEGVLERLAPRDLADEWDNVGLLIGDPDQRVERILVALEVTGDVLREARRRKSQAIVVHHPLLFKAFKKLQSTHPVQRLVMEAVKAEVAVIAEHTNLDRSPQGTNRALADRIGLVDTGILEPAARNDLLKFVVFVPLGYEERIIEAVGRAGAGVIGQYSHCTFRSPGTGTYIPLEGADPFAGKIGKLEQAEEVRLECVVNRRDVGRLFAEVRAAHPYEEMAYDVYPLVGVESQSKWGLGLVGVLRRATTLEELARRLKRSLKCSGVQIVGDRKASISRVAVSTGSGGSVLEGLSAEAADVFVTGEIDHHDAAEALARGMRVVCVGHWESEVIVVPYVAKWLREQPEIGERGVRVLEVESERGPFLTV